MTPEMSGVTFFDSDSAPVSDLKTRAPVQKNFKTLTPNPADTPKTSKKLISKR